MHGAPMRSHLERLLERSTWRLASEAEAGRGFKAGDGEEALGTVPAGCGPRDLFSANRFRLSREPHMPHLGPGRGRHSPSPGTTTPVLRLCRDGTPVPGGGERKGRRAGSLHQALAVSFHSAQPWPPPPFCKE